MDVIIIGGGFGGLACAALLTQRGLGVRVLEQSARIGGAIQSYYRGGMVMDTGFHYVGGLGQGQSLRPAFEQLGLMALPWHQLDAEGFDRVMIGGRDYRLACGYDHFAEVLAEAFPREREALRQYVAMLQEDVPADVGAYGYLRQTFSDPLLISVLSGAAMRLELRRASLPLHVFAHCQAPYIESSWRLRGDGGQIADAMAAQVTAGGGEVRCRAGVERLVVRGGRVVEAQCLGGECHEARWFISSLHPAATMQLLAGHRPGIYYRHVAQMENTGGMLTVSLLLRPLACAMTADSH